MRPRIRAAARRARKATPSVVREVLGEVDNDRVLGLAAETAFFTVLSLFPALLIATGLLSLLDVILGAELARQTQDEVTGALNLILTDQASDTVATVEAFFEGSYGGLLTFASIGALVTLSGAWAVLIEALNLAYDTGEKRSWLRRRLLGLGLGVVTVLVVVVSLTVLVVGPLLGRGDDLAALVGLGDAFAWTWNLLRLPTLFVAVTAWIMFIFHVAPNRSTRWRDTLPGAVSASVLWLLATAGFHLYLRLVGQGNPVLGAFGGGAIVMLWVYLLSVALLIGGELNAVLERRRGSRRRRAGA